MTNVEKVIEAMRERAKTVDDWYASMLLDDFADDLVKALTKDNVKND